VVCLLWWFNYELDSKIQKALMADHRNANFSLKARYNHFVDINTLVLDLYKASNVSPVDLCRGLFQSAEGLYDADKRFDNVILANQGAAVFTMAGNDFYTLGREFATGQNPVYLISYLASKA
jgi:hypothetical protein